MKFKQLSRLALAGLGFVFSVGSMTSCKNDNEVEPIKEGIERSEITLTSASGESVSAHGDHFHGLDGGTEGEKIVITFDETGKATQNGHLHLPSEAVYKLELKAWDYNGVEVQNQFIANKATADLYKAFLIGGDFVLNTDTQDETGAIFQPRESKYVDGTAVNGKYEMTGIVSYFTAGHRNEGATKKVAFVLRKLEAGVKAKVERVDWNRTDYKTVFPGTDILELKFEIHSEGEHAH
ncbi:hypothetical protein [Sphingobacterium deserti]|uniref:Lipoprotein n=1 Tax=Sphingobacterium deserti TaxID=1229276 RepID=A0A0B8T3W5_9SPHI|nr:hypothetical protein [Sphingobacterium deserti]KGE15946.1 hypothetical protein DI53_0061 [Sphingobacterium deserti]